MATIDTIKARITEMISEGKTDSVILEDITSRYPEKDGLELEDFLNDLRNIHTLSISRKGVVRVLSPEQLVRMATYYSTISNTALEASTNGAYVHLAGTELAVLRLFERFYKTLEDTSVKKVDGQWYFRFKNN